MNCSAPGLPVPHHILHFAQVHVHCISDPIQPSQLLSPLFPCAFSLCQHQGLFQLVGWSRQVTKYWSFSFSISPSNECSGLISCRIDWFDLLAIQGTLKSLLQHHNSKASILQCSVKTSSLGYNHKIQQKNVLQKGENSPNLTNADKHQERRI